MKDRNSILYIIFRLDIVCCLRPARDYFTHMVTSARPGEGLQNLGPFRDLYRDIPAETRSLGFCDIVRRTAQFNAF